MAKSLVAPARDALRRRPRTERRSHRPAGSPRVSDRRDHRRGAGLRRRRRRAGRWQGEEASSRRFCSGAIGFAWPTPGRSGSQTRRPCLAPSRGATRITRICDLGAIHRSRRVGVLAFQSAPRPPVAAVTRAQHGAAPPAHRRAVGPGRTGHRHRRLQRRREQRRASGHSSRHRRAAAAPFVDTFRVRAPRRDRRRDVHRLHVRASRVRTRSTTCSCSPGTDVLDAAIVRTSRNERYPSDHFPVVARIRLKRLRSSDPQTEALETREVMGLRGPEPAPEPVNRTSGTP